MECSYCHTHNPPGTHYCNNCGKLLDPGAATSAGSASTNTSASSGGSTGNSRSLTPGSRVQHGRYIIKKVLGEGGMGAALLSTDTRLDDKSVVLKELISDNTDPSKLQEDVRNFKREVATLAHIDHPLVPNVTDHFQEGSRYFMVQEYIEGENLEDRIERVNQSLKEREVLGYASEILDVLDYLSQQHPPIVHRDIKPANIIIGTKDKRAHLVDFGIARPDLTATTRHKQTSALGTPGYAPPEQYQGNADPRSDLYALAATLHHLLTNRDPRNEAPFTYPPVRTLNPQLSPEVERVLSHALTNDMNQRYQNAAAMKRELDDILLKRFNVSGAISSYTLGTSGPISTTTTVPTSLPVAAAVPVNQSSQIQRSSPNTPWQGLGPGGAIGSRPPGNNVRRNFLIFIIIIFAIASLLYVGLPALRNRGSNLSNDLTSVSSSIPSSGIGVTKTASGEYVGVSDGTFAFDAGTGRSDSDLKNQAAETLKQGNTNSASALLSQAVAKDTNDAEALIYLEDQKALNGPHVTLVVGTMLTGGDVGVGRDSLQGAYVAQKEFNDGAKLGGTKVRLLIANSGSQADYVTPVAQQIVKLAQSDHTFVGVMGWPFSSRAINAVRVLSAAGIPMVSQTASSDSLTNTSSYFFRVAPSNKSQGIAGAQYIANNLNKHKIALFVDPTDSYSQSLANDFSQQFTADGNTIVATENYTVGTKGQGKIPSLLQDALGHNPDAIYFSGYAADVSTVLTDLSAAGAPAGLPVIGGDALYELGGYASSARADFTRLRFTSFAYPDEWGVQGLTAKKPAFFDEYANAYDPDKRHTGGPYGYTRSDSDTMLSYDATLALLTGCNNALSGGKASLTPNDLRQGLTKITGTQAIQGVSGQISFGTDGNPINKAIVILAVSPEGFIQMQSTVLGTFLKQ